VYHPQMVVLVVLVVECSEIRRGGEMQEENMRGTLPHHHTPLLEEVMILDTIDVWLIVVEITTDTPVITATSATSTVEGMEGTIEKMIMDIIKESGVV